MGITDTIAKSVKELSNYANKAYNAGMASANATNERSAEESSVGPTGKNYADLNGAYQAPAEKPSGWVNDPESNIWGNEYSAVWGDYGTPGEQYGSVNENNKEKENPYANVTNPFASIYAAENQPENLVVNIPDVGDNGYLLNPENALYESHYEKPQFVNTTPDPNAYKNSTYYKALQGDADARKSFDNADPEHQLSAEHAAEAIDARRGATRFEDQDYLNYYNSLDDSLKQGVSPTLGDALLYDDFDTLSRWMTSEGGKYWYEDPDNIGGDTDLYGNEEARRAWYDAGKANNIINPFEYEYGSPELIEQLLQISGGNPVVASSLYESLTNYIIGASEALKTMDKLQPYAKYYAGLKFSEDEDRDNKANMYANETFLTHMLGLDNLDEYLDNLNTSNVNRMMRGQNYIYAPEDSEFTTTNAGGDYDYWFSDSPITETHDATGMYNREDALDQYRTANVALPDQIYRKLGYGNKKAS